MAVTERDRFNAYKQLVETMGEEVATTLMEMLPGTGWADVATKGDIGRLEQRMDRFEQRMDKHFYAGIGITCTIMGLVGAAARFL